MAEMRPAHRRFAIAFVVIGLALIVARTLASASDGELVAHVPRNVQGGEPAAGPEASAPVRRADAATPSLHLERLANRAAPAASVGSEPPALFASQSWQPTPPPPLPPVPVEPQAPPFPYTYMGGLSDERGRTAFFNRGDRVLAVQAGETIDGAFRVDHLDQNLMNLTYMPLNKPVQVALGAGR